MTKISQSEYIKTITMKVRSRFEHMIYNNMINEMNMLTDNLDTRRVIEDLLEDSLYLLSKELLSYIEETGVPRKRRESKDSEKTAKKSNAYVEFCKMHRNKVASEMKLENKNMILKASDVTKRLSEMWNERENDKRKTYYNEDDDEEEE